MELEAEEVVASIQFKGESRNFLKGLELGRLAYWVRMDAGCTYTCA